jgi:hypothetical protein
VEVAKPKDKFASQRDKCNKEQGQFNENTGICVSKLQAALMARNKALRGDDDDEDWE